LGFLIYRSIDADRAHVPLGFELDRKMAALLDHLHVPVPDALLTKG
jgi:hypothetical protein